MMKWIVFWAAPWVLYAGAEAIDASIPRDSGWALAGVFVAAFLWSGAVALPWLRAVDQIKAEYRREAAQWRHREIHEAVKRTIRDSHTGGGGHPPNQKEQDQ